MNASKNSSDNKTIFVGCLGTLAVIVPWFAFLPWKIATTLAVTSLIIYYLIGIIYHEFKKSILKKNTKRVTINNLPRYGYQKLIAKIKPEKAKTTWFTKEPADYRWLVFEEKVRSSTSDADSTTSYRYDWKAFHNEESHVKTMEIMDATGSCLVGMHNIQFNTKQKIKTYTSEALLTLIQDGSFPELSRDKIKEAKNIRVIEKWIPTNHSVFFYGTINKLSLNAPPEDIVKEAEKSRRLGVDNFEMHRNPSRLLKREDWQHLMEAANKQGRTSVDILLDDYGGGREINEISMSITDNISVNFRAILLYLFGIVLVVTISYAFMNDQFPEFIDQVIQWINAG